jgi:copper homeostasis protein
LSNKAKNDILVYTNEMSGAKTVIEIIATNIKDALEIELGGADRIELVSALEIGGLTPCHETTKEVINAVRIPVNVMIRPHADSFVYTDEEITSMKEEIKIAQDLGANGVVLGVLNDNNTIDTHRLESLLSVCRGLDVTFHRAIDETNVLASVKQLQPYNEITNILTSGGLTTSLQENIEVIKEMILSASRTNILVGGGLTLGNVGIVALETGATHFHFGTAVQINGGVTIEKVKEVVSKVNSLSF